MITKIKNYFSQSHKRKIQILIYTTIISLSLFLVTLSYLGINKLYTDSSKEMDVELKTLNEEYLKNYINITGNLIDSKIAYFHQELFTLADIYQQFLDNSDELKPVVNALNSSKFSQNTFNYNGKWLQNAQNKNSVLLLPKYLLESNGSINNEISDEISNTSILDLLMPSFYNYGTHKLWIYYEGPENKEFIRATPWQDIGTTLYDIYPNFINTPLWNEFNPGLVDSWEKLIQKKHLNLQSLAVMKEPYQDGGTGEIVTTINHPIWDKERKTFKGAINIDIQLKEITSYINDIQIGKSGFAYISQSNGNILALNDYGSNILGLPNLNNSKLSNSSSKGYNSMIRHFKESRHESVQNIELPKNNFVYFSEFTIGSKDFVIVQKPISPINFWSPEKGYYKERWILGFIIPKEELYFVSFNMSSQIKNSRDSIFISQLLSAFLLSLFLGVLVKFILTKLTLNLNKLEFFAEEITKKNYDCEINIDSNDEIGKLSKVFKTMIVEIKNTLQKMQSQNEELMSEIKSRKMHQEQVKYLTEYDFLTDLPKERLFIEKLEDSLNNNRQGFIILIGIDDFKNINKVFGYTGGNNILNIISKKLIQNTLDSSIISRISGDEFAILYENISNTDDIVSHFKLLQNIFSNPLDINDKKIFISASMGVSVYPKDSSNAIDLIRFASSALFQAKKIGKGSYSFYDINIHELDEKRIALINALKSALLNNEFHLVFQPQVDIDENRIVGMESLIRWTNPVFGNIPPTIFIPLAEEIGIIGDIGRWVLKESCSFGSYLSKKGFNNLSIAVNISAIQFIQNDLILDVLEAINLSKFDPNNLELEVTESFFINNIDYVNDILSELRGFGVKIAVDDFGTGYSSLSYIKDLPTDKLKIDRSFIKDYPQKDNGSIASVIIHLANNLNIKTIAEGVETKEQESYLFKNGCHLIQGYLYSKPLDKFELLDFLKNYNKKSEP